MSRVNRDELLACLRALSHIVQMSLANEYDIPDEVTIPRMPRDGAVLETASSPVRDGAPMQPYGKGQPQPPRKSYTLAPKVKLDRVDGLRRSELRVATDVGAHPYGTSHEIMARLAIKRSTFSNAMATLLKRKIVIATPVRNGAHAPSR